jgi:hypothetical protein
MHERPTAWQRGRVVLTAACRHTRDAVRQAQLHTSATAMHSCLQQLATRHIADIEHTKRACAKPSIGAVWGSVWHRRTRSYFDDLSCSAQSA